MKKIARIATYLKKCILPQFDDYGRFGMYEVIVGNIGSVYCGGDKFEARRLFDVYVDQSKTCVGGRAYQESVTLFKDGEVYAEYAGEIEAENFF